ncbi:DegT/DnrJ/EryC1/StrS family aminotransferase [Candidatus Saccharibacteria bacterium]|nr:DegT/DnrJ/EryC1/StrS family aminotransferase [Candidatus Saccharibacteria bacterium]
MKYFLGLSSTFSAGDTLRHTFAIGSEYDLSELRAYLAAHFGATYDHVAIYANGRTALSEAIKAVTRRGGKVVVTSLTCYAVIQAVKNAGCVPVFADVNKETLHFGKKELEKALEGETGVEAIIVQNNLGIPIDITEIEEVAKDHKLAIIEDLAHCAGVRYPDGREVGTVGRAVALSFGKGKSIDAVTGGAVIFTDSHDAPVTQPVEPPKFKDNFRARFYPLFSAIIRGFYGIHPKLGRGLTALLLKIHWIKRSADGKISPDTRLTFWQCKLALRGLQSLPRHRSRKPLRDYYLVDDRDAVLDELEKQGFFFQDIWYTTPVAPERYFHKADFHPDACPVASEIATKIINLPTWYNKSDLLPALRIIKPHLVEGEIDLPKEEKKDVAESSASATDDDGNRDSGDNDTATGVNSDSAESVSDSDEKAAKDSSKDQSEKNKRAKKTEKVEVNKFGMVKVKKIKELPGVIQKAKKSLSGKKKSSEKGDSAKKESSTSQKAQKTPLFKKKEKDLSELEQQSGLLSKLAEQEEKAKEEQEEAKKQAEKAKQQEKRVEEKQEEKTKQQAKRKDEKQSQNKEQKSRSESANTYRKQPEKHPAHVITRTDSMPGMRKAPEKLSDREILKAELEQGKKGGNSVI